MSELATWYDVTNNVRALLRRDYDSGSIEDLDDNDALADYAHEWAGGDAVVIYYHHSRALWLDSAIVRGFEDEADELGNKSADIDAKITACVYLALHAEIMDAIEELRQELADA